MVGLPDCNKPTATRAAFSASYREAAAELPGDVWDEVWEGIFCRDSSLPAEVSRDPRAIHITGKLLRGSYLVEIEGTELGFTGIDFLAFVLLVVGRLKAGARANGITNLLPLGQTKDNVQQIVRRLRRKIDESLSRPGLGMSYIVHAKQASYFLDVPCDAITIHRGRLDELVGCTEEGGRLHDNLTQLLAIGEAFDA